ncbi:MAG: hypothetical protein ACI4F9_00855 [Lachnospiraceae bacterium]
MAFKRKMIIAIAFLKKLCYNRKKSFCGGGLASDINAKKIGKIVVFASIIIR